MREKDNKIPADDIDTFGFTEEELEMLGQLAGEMLERETRAYEERIQNTPELRDLKPDEKILAMLRRKTESGQRPDGGKRSTRPYALRPYFS